MKQNFKTHSRHKTILFVDDEVLMTKWFERTFGSDFHIVCVNSVDDALLILQANTYDVGVVVTDFRMPGRDGLDLLRTLATSQPAIVKILASAYADKDLVIQAINQQLVYKVIEKPWDDQVIRKVLSQALVYHHDYVLERQKLSDSMMGIRESLGFLAHELSSPLSTIDSYLGMLQDKDVSLAATQSTMASAQQRIQFCLNLVRCFTESSRQAFAKSDISGVSATQLLQLILSELPISSAQRQAITLQTGHDFLISSKQNLVYLCLTSIINNALRELGQQPSHPNPRIHIDVGFQQQNWLRITDNAQGIAPDVFLQLLKQPITTHEGRGGSGMGLMFCQKVMTSFGGDLTLETRHASQGFTSNQTGTSVYLHFPALES